MVVRCDRGILDGSNNIVGLIGNVSDTNDSTTKLIQYIKTNKPGIINELVRGCLKKNIPAGAYDINDDDYYYNIVRYYSIPHVYRIAIADVSQHSMYKVLGYDIDTSQCGEIHKAIFEQQNKLHELTKQHADILKNAIEHGTPVLFVVTNSTNKMCDVDVCVMFVNVDSKTLSDASNSNVFDCVTLLMSFDRSSSVVSRLRVKFDKIEKSMIVDGCCVSATDTTAINAYQLVDGEVGCKSDDNKNVAITFEGDEDVVDDTMRSFLFCMYCSIFKRDPEGMSGDVVIDKIKNICASLSSDISQDISLPKIDGIDYSKANLFRNKESWMFINDISRIAFDSDDTNGSKANTFHVSCKCLLRLLKIFELMPCKIECDDGHFDRYCVVDDAGAVVLCNTQQHSDCCRCMHVAEKGEQYEVKMSSRYSEDDNDKNHLIISLTKLSDNTLITFKIDWLLNQNGYYGENYLT